MWSGAQENRPLLSTVCAILATKPRGAHLHLLSQWTTSTYLSCNSLECQRIGLWSVGVHFCNVNLAMGWRPGPGALHHRQEGEPRTGWTWPPVPWPRGHRLLSILACWVPGLAGTQHVQVLHIPTSMCEASTGHQKQKMCGTGKGLITGSDWISTQIKTTQLCY